MRIVAVGATLVQLGQDFFPTLLGCLQIFIYLARIMRWEKYLWLKL